MNAKFKGRSGAAFIATVTLSLIFFAPVARAQDKPAPNAGASPSWMALVSTENSFNFTFYRDLKAVASVGAGGWAPAWGWRPFSARVHATGDDLTVAADLVANKAAGQILHVTLTARQAGPSGVSFQYYLNADKDVPLTMFVSSLTTGKDFQDGEATVLQSDGTEKKLPLSFKGLNGTGPASKITFNSRSLGTYSVAIDPPIALMTDGQARVLLAGDHFAAGTKTVTLTYTFPQPIRLAARDEDLAQFTKPMAGPDWFPFGPSQDLGPSALGFEDWLDKPAGKHGGVRLVGDHFQFEDGAPVKFWGTNLAFKGAAPPKTEAEFTAARFAKWGVNAVRLHKFTGSGWSGIGDPRDCTKMDPAGLDKLDYFAAQLAKNGVYYGWSHTYRLQVKPGNRDQLLAYDEIQKNLGGDTYGLINFAPDVQDLLIQSVVNLLQHPNPYTGKTYAQDPALCYIEAQNEDDIFFFTSTVLDKCPTYKKAVMTQFSTWLGEKYGTTDALKTAWGGALNGGETLEAKNIGIQTNPWNFGDGLPTAGGARQRMLDNAAFFHELQNRFYGKFAKAVRDAGYQGPLVGSPWFTASGLPLYYNLKSDAMAGYVDRHDYFGGKLWDTMLTAPGSGTLSMGLQQVAGRPFGLSEWIHVYPSLYSAEGPAILAAYGFGLQGWDASYEFQSQAGTKPFRGSVGAPPFGVWEADTPAQIGQFPVLARMIARGDVKEGEVISTRRISPQDLETGHFNFSERATQQGDVKAISGSVPPAALAAGRCLVDFATGPGASNFPDMAKYQQGDIITSTTGQLKWSGGEKPFLTINTPGTRGVVGFASGQVQHLGNVDLTLNCPYASVIVTAAGREESLANAKHALISAVARNSNSGMTYFTLDGHLVSNGKSPILMEPVKATFTFTRRQIASVNILDHDGKETGRTLPVTNGSFAIDGAQDRALWYEVNFR